MSLLLAGCASHLVPAAARHAGFGATRAEWNRTHHLVRAKGCVTGEAYDEDRRLRAFPGCPGSVYVAVDGVGGRVLAYRVNFPAGTSLRTTLDREKRELPGDAVRVARKFPPGCVITQYRSPWLGRVDPSGAPGGLVAVASQTAPDGRRYLDFLPLDIAAVRTC